MTKRDLDEIVVLINVLRSTVDDARRAIKPGELSEVPTATVTKVSHAAHTLHQRIMRHRSF